MVKAPARSSLGHVTPEEFEQLSTNGACGKQQAEPEGGDRFLGALHAGYGGEADRAGRRIIATFKKAVEFLNTMVGRIEPLYRRHGAVAYEMVRHGTVDVNRPHSLKRRSDATI